jgi:hypothetical protein
MLASLTRAPRSRKRQTPRFGPLFLERLEDRLSPTSVSPPSPTTENLSLNVTYQQNQQVTLSGQLTNSSGPIANEGVNFSGAVTGTATTNAQGAYSVTLKASQLGTVSAVSADGQSNIAQYTLVSNTPTITSFEAESLGAGLWEFFGTVANAPTQGEVINFGGLTALEGQSVSVNSNGSFSYYCIVNSGQGGWATAEAVDWWGDTSQMAVTMVNC